MALSPNMPNFHNSQIRNKLMWMLPCMAKRNFADIIKNLQIGKSSWIIGDPNVNIRFLIKWGERVRVKERNSMLLILRRRGWGPGAKEWKQPLGARKGKNSKEKEKRKKEKKIGMGLLS